MHDILDSQSSMRCCHVTFVPGGYVIKRFDLRCASIIRLCAVATLLTGLFSFLFFLDCPNVEYTGYSVGYLNPVNK